jgi:uncharacterized protein (TIGR03382 family)
MRTIRSSVHSLALACTLFAVVSIDAARAEACSPTAPLPAAGEVESVEPSLAAFPSEVPILFYARHGAGVSLAQLQSFASVVVKHDGVEIQGTLVPTRGGDPNPSGYGGVYGFQPLAGTFPAGQLTVSYRPRDGAEIQLVTISSRGGVLAPSPFAFQTQRSVSQDSASKLACTNRSGGSCGGDFENATYWGLRSFLSVGALALMEPHTDDAYFRRDVVFELRDAKGATIEQQRSATGTSFEHLGAKVCAKVTDTYIFDPVRSVAAPEQCEDVSNVATPVTDAEWQKHQESVASLCGLSTEQAEVGIAEVRGNAQGGGCSTAGGPAFTCAALGALAMLFRRRRTQGRSA